jgi:AraC-like DNA-binding protein
MGQVTVQGGIPRIAYEMGELFVSSLGSQLAGFVPSRWQPYPEHRGKRLSAPALDTAARAGFTEIVQAGDGLHTIITDWPSGASPEAVWAETVPGEHGYLYIGLEGDGRVQLEGLGHARRQGASCSVTVAPPESTQVWRSGPTVVRRGVCIAFQGRYLRSRYPDLLARCRGSLGPWLANSESRLRDFDVPLSPVMHAVTSALLSTRLEGQFRYDFVRSTTEQLLCLAIAALADRTSAPNRLSARDREILENVRKTIHESLIDPPRVEVLAGRFGINRNKLRFGFKEIFGTTVSEYLLEQRMRVAFDLLEQQSQSVGEVAAQVGYAHLCNFTTAFKHRFGQTPSKVARRL